MTKLKIALAVVVGVVAFLVGSGALLNLMLQPEEIGEDRVGKSVGHLCRGDELLSQATLKVAYRTVSRDSGCVVVAWLEQAQLLRLREQLARQVGEPVVWLQPAPHLEAVLGASDAARFSADVPCEGRVQYKKHRTAPGSPRDIAETFSWSTCSDGWVVYHQQPN